jgi:hypothetical protein
MFHNVASNASRTAALDGVTYEYQNHQPAVPLQAGGNNMKQNDGCALEKWVDGRWVPLAIRYQRFTAVQIQQLGAGRIVATAGDVQIRRFDWAERQAIILALDKSLTNK